MAVWSSLRTVFRANIPQKNLFDKISQCHSGVGQRLMSEHKVMHITPSRFQWEKFKDVVHYYLMVGLIPVGLLVLYANVCIGPAQLIEIPQDYTPRHWEYYKHPITRYLAKHVYRNPQQEYEKYLHYVYEEMEKTQLRALEKKIKQKMAERHDYQVYYYRPVTTKYARLSKEEADKLAALEGDEI